MLRGLDAAPSGEAVPLAPGCDDDALARTHRLRIVNGMGAMMTEKRAISDMRSAKHTVGGQYGMGEVVADGRDEMRTRVVELEWGQCESTAESRVARRDALSCWAAGVDGLDLRIERV